MKQRIITVSSLVAFCLCSPAPALAQSGGFIAGNPQATVRGGASANIDVVEGGGSGTASGTVSIKYSATLDTARKHYAKFVLTGSPNTNGPLWIRYDTAANSQRQDVSVWTLDQEFPAFTASTLTWNTAQANDPTSGSGFLTNASGFTATYYRNFLSSSSANAVDVTHQLNGPWGHMLRPGNVVYMALSSTNNLGDNGLRLAVNSLEIGYDTLTTGAPPSLGEIPGITVAQAQTSDVYSFTVGDPEDGPGGLNPVAASSNETILPSANVFFGGAGASRTVYVIGGGTVGTATITVTIVDSHGNQATRSFVVTVRQANAAPILVAGGLTNAIAPTNTLLNQPVTIPFSVSDAETAPGGLTITAELASYSTAILQSAVISGLGPNNNLSVTVTPQAGAVGVGVVRLNVSDPDGNTTSAAFCVMVRPSPQVVFIEQFEYDGLNSKLTDQAPNFWTRRNASAQSVFLRSGTDAFTGAKVAWLRPNAGAEDLAAPLAGGPYSPESGAVLYVKLNATFADQAAGGPGINTITNGDGPFFRLSPAPTSTTDFVDLFAVGTNGVADPDTEFRVFVGNGTDATVPWPVSFTKPINLATETGPVTLVTRYDLAEGKAVLWVNGVSESDPRVNASDDQPPVPVGYVGLFQERGNGDIYVDSLTVTLVVKPRLTAIVPPRDGVVSIDFSAGANDAAGDFEMEQASSVTGSFASTQASITSSGSGNFTAKLAASAAQGYYRVKRKPIAF